jgi:hypothetical protein
MLASRQIRLHTSSACDFYLHVHSRPIIEHCSKFRFAPYPLTHPSLTKDLTDAGLKTVGDPAVASLWQQVDDFNWHRVQASPNWSVLPPSDRATESAHDSFRIDWSPHEKYLKGGFARALHSEEGGSSAGDEGGVESKADTGVAATLEAPAMKTDPVSAAAVAGGASADAGGESDDEL